MIANNVEIGAKERRENIKTQKKNNKKKLKKTHPAIYIYIWG